LEASLNPTLSLKGRQRVGWQVISPFKVKIAHVHLDWKNVARWGEDNVTQTPITLTNLAQSVVAYPKRARIPK
jgi:hypothetical protein